jgi:DNA-binding XRE family transcriptional regulator
LNGAVRDTPSTPATALAAAERLNDVVSRHNQASYADQSYPASKTDHDGESEPAPEPVLNETDKDYAKGVGLRLRAIREELGLNGREMAERLDVSRPRYYQWELGKHLPHDIRAVVKICAMSDATLDWVYRGALGGMPSALQRQLYKRVEDARRPE